MTQSGATRAVYMLSTLLGMLSFGAKPAAACTLACNARFLPDLLAIVPRNTPALVILHFEPGAGEVRLTRIDGSRNEPLSVRLEPLPATFESGMHITLIRYEQPLVEGGRYVLEHTVASPSECAAKPRMFDVGPKVALPSEIGTLTVTPSRCGKISSLCPANPSYWGTRSDLSLTISDQALPWRGLLLYRSVINGGAAGYKSGLTFHSPEGQVVMPCTADGTPQSEPYELALEAMLPGGTETWRTPVVPHEMKCEPKPVDMTAVRMDALAAGAGGSAALAAQTDPAAEGCSIPGKHSRADAWGFALCALALARALVRKAGRC